MHTLDWEWKYKIFFDDTIKEDVQKFINILLDDEKNIFQSVLNFYSSFYTIGVLLKCISAKKENEEQYIKKAKSNIHLLVKTPRESKEQLEEEIKELGSLYEKDLLDLLNDSLESKLSYSVKDYLKIILGDKLYTDFSNYLTSLPEKNISSYDELPSISNYSKESILNCICQLNTNKKLNRIFGVPDKSDFDVKYEEGDTYGEWWDASLYDKFKKDTLVIIKRDEFDTNDVLYTLLHEVYPGHRHFFKETSGSNFDTGAYLLVEGYATYVECHSLDSKYSVAYYNYYLGEAKNILFGKNISHEGLSYWYSQFVGYYESYYIGCFLVKYLVEIKFNGQVTEMFNYLKARTKGDFFKLW